MASAKQTPVKPSPRAEQSSQLQIRNAICAPVSYTKILPKPVSKDAQNRNLTKAGEREIAADLGFQTCAQFHQWLDSPLFKAYRDELQQWKEEHVDLKMDRARPKAYFKLLDELVSKPQAKRDKIDCAYFEGTPGDAWKNHDFFLSTLLRIFVANQEVQDYGYDIGPFPHDMPQERWHKLWNAIQWCRTKNFFTPNGRASAAKRSYVNNALARPWYMQQGHGQDAEDLEMSTRPDAAEEEPPFPKYFITWTNMPAVIEKDGLMKEITLALPELCEFPSFETFKQHITREFQLHERELKVRDLLFTVESGPQASLTRKKVAVYWEYLTKYQLEGYMMNFFLVSEALKQVDLDLMVEKTIIPPVLARKYQYAPDGLIEQKDDGDYEVASIPTKRKHDAIKEDEAAEDGKRRKPEEASVVSEEASVGPEEAGVVSAEASVVPEFEEHYYKNEAILRRADGLSDAGKVSVHGEEPDLEDDSMVEDDGKTIDLSTDDEDELDDESNDTGDDRISEGLDPPAGGSIASKFDLTEDLDYVDEGTSSDEEDQQTLPPRNKTPDEKIGANKNTLDVQNAFHHGEASELSDPYHYRGLDGPRRRKPVLRSAPDSDAASSGELQQVQDKDLPTEDVRELELGAENQFRLHDSDEVTQKQVKPSEKLKASLEKLSRLLDKYNYSEEPLLPDSTTQSRLRKEQKRWTEALQLTTDCHCEPHRAKPTQETLHASAAIANMRLTGKYFENEDDVNEFWEKYWSLLRAASGVDQDDVGPNLMLSAEVLQLNQDGYIPGMTGLKPRPAQQSGAAWLFAKEQESGLIRSADGKHEYHTMATLGGIVCDIPGAGKTLMCIMHHQNIINRMPPAGGVYKPSMYIVPKIAIGQWYDTFRNNAPHITVFVIWGKKNFRKTADWMAANISAQDLENGPEGVPERLKFAFDTTDPRAASVAFAITKQTCESRFKDPSAWRGRFVRCFIDEAHCIKDPDASISKVVKGFQFKYRHLITATPMINDKKISLALRTISTVRNGLTNMDTKKILTYLTLKSNSLTPESVDAARDVLADEFKRLREIMPKIMQPVQLRGANGTKLPVGDGSYVVMGDDLPPYEAITIDLCMESSAANE
ncbi:hypothetical protein EDD37DRAFT_698041 [Exophiala viscosa]|uniref:uncharacterized protein n=1 Tax=Exophiala viscosa TaxID=2486360 RepID=UPI0021A15B75|nr:hypothetical protein EDD37DRAFT_698041 [Exophiala viscosa]